MNSGYDMLDFDADKLEELADTIIRLSSEINEDVKDAAEKTIRLSAVDKRWSVKGTQDFINEMTLYKSDTQELYDHNVILSTKITDMIEGMVAINNESNKPVEYNTDGTIKD